MNYKRKKPRTKVRCTLCTDNRTGNSNAYLSRQNRRALLSFKEQKSEV